MTAYTNHGKMSTAMRNSGQKPNVTERNRRTLKSIVFKIHRTTAAKLTEELDIYLEDPFSTRTV
jgi:hypothetical protein